MNIKTIKNTLSVTLLLVCYTTGVGQGAEAVATKTADSIQVDDQLAEINYNQAIDYYSKGHYDSALRALNRTISVKSDFAEAFNNSGTVPKPLTTVEP